MYELYIIIYIIQYILLIIVCVNRIPNNKKYETLLSTSEFVHASSKIRHC